MKLHPSDNHKSGIYCIRNIVNNKVYIGKAKNIYTRIIGHIHNLRVKSKDENRHLINAWHKYGEDKFEYFVIEYLEFDEELLKKRELFWILNYDAINPEKGYNLRLDSSTGLIVQDETRKIMSQNAKGKNNPNYGNKWSDEKKKYMSELKKRQYKEGIVKSNIENTLKGLAVRDAHWKANPNLKKQMAEKVKKAITKYKIYQFTKEGELVKVWDYVSDIIKENPNYKRHNIYAVCSGEKPSIYGYKWRKVLNDDIVQSDIKVSV